MKDLDKKLNKIPQTAFNCYRDWSLDQQDQPDV